MTVLIGTISTYKLLREGNARYPQNMNVWDGILEDAIIRPLFTDGNLNGARHAVTLDDIIQP